jgi:hypothetical protein
MESHGERAMTTAVDAVRRQRRKRWIESED